MNAAYREIRLAAIANSIEEALNSIHEVAADVMVVDHDSGAGSWALERVAAVVPVLVLTESSRECLGAHVCAVVRKSESPVKLLRAIEQAFQRTRRQVDDPPPAWVKAKGYDETSAADAENSKIARLTVRERELIVALLCCDTEPGKVIASRLAIREQTLRNHLSSIYEKLGVHSRLGLHAFAVEHGLDRQLALAQHRPEKAGH